MMDVEDVPVLALWVSLVVEEPAGVFVAPATKPLPPADTPTLPLLMPPLLMIAALDDAADWRAALAEAEEFEPVFAVVVAVAGFEPALPLLSPETTEPVAGLLRAPVPLVRLLELRLLFPVAAAPPVVVLLAAPVDTAAVAGTELPVLALGRLPFTPAVPVADPPALAPAPPPPPAAPPPPAPAASALPLSRLAASTKDASFSALNMFRSTRIRSRSRHGTPQCSTSDSEPRSQGK